MKINENIKKLPNFSETIDVHSKVNKVEDIERFDFMDFVKVGNPFVVLEAGDHVLIGIKTVWLKRFVPTDGFRLMNDQICEKWGSFGIPHLRKNNKKITWYTTELDESMNSIIDEFKFMIYGFNTEKVKKEGVKVIIQTLRTLDKFKRTTDIIDYEVF